MTRECPYQPARGYTSLGADRASRVRLYDGTTAWFVHEHADVRALLTDPRVSADRTSPGYPQFAPRVELAHRPVRVFMFMDEPAHRDQRTRLTARFTVRFVASRRPHVERLVSTVLDRFAATGPEADLVSGYALPIASGMLSDLIGVPAEDVDRFHGWLRTLASPSPTAEAGIELVAYCEDLVHAKVSRPAGDTDLPSALARHLATGELGEQDVLAMCMLLLFAGHEATSNMISLGVYTLLRHPDQLARVRDGEVPLPTAVEELLRYLSVVDAIQRVAAADIHLGDVTIRRGDGIILPLSAANRDPGVFEDPETFDVARHPRRHVTFGYGPHQCLGQNLARLTLHTAIGALFDRLPDLRVETPTTPLAVNPANGVQGFTSLPVRWS
jgi:pentalenic acid synthase